MPRVCSITTLAAEQRVYVPKTRIHHYISIKIHHNRGGIIREECHLSENEKTTLVGDLGRLRSLYFQISIRVLRVLVML